MKKYKMILAICFLFFFSCQNKYTKQELIQMSNLKSGSDLSNAKFIWVDCDSIRKRLGVPILGNNFYSSKKEYYRTWLNPDTVAMPRLISIIHNIRYYENDSIAFNHEIGEIQLNDSLSLAYAYNSDFNRTSYSLHKLDLKSKRGTYTYAELSRKEFDSIISVFGSKDILNY